MKTKESNEAGYDEDLLEEIQEEENDGSNNKSSLLRIFEI
jgi:hypothetical protein